MMTEFQMEPERFPPAWIFVPGLLVASWSWFIRTDDVKFKIACLGSAALCVIGIVASLRLWKAARVLAVTVLALYWVVVGAVSFFTLLSPALMLVYAGFLTIPAFLIVGLCTAYARRGLRRAWWLASSVGGFSCGFIIVALLSAPDLKRAADETRPWTRATEPTTLEEDMVKLVKCSREFAKLHPETGYPESLHLMGPHGTGCLPEAILIGSYKELLHQLSPWSAERTRRDKQLYDQRGAGYPPWPGLQHDVNG